MSKIKKDWENENAARFVCCMTLFWPDGKKLFEQRYSKRKNFS